MGTSPFLAAVDAIARPLESAVRDDFAHIDGIRGLEGEVQQACRAALSCRVPGDVQAALGKLASAFSEPLEDRERRAKVRWALEMLALWRAPGFAEEMLSRPLSVLPGVGPKRSESFARRGLGRVVDLLFHLPTCYDDRRALVRVCDLEVGRRASFIAEVRSVGSAPSRGGRRPGRILRAVVADDTGSVSLKWFRGGEAVEPILRRGKRLLVTGDVKRYRFEKELVHPDVEPIDDPKESTGSEREPPSNGGDLQRDLDALRRIVPDYTTPEGIGLRSLRRLVERAVAEYADLVEGYLPGALVASRGLPEPADAVRTLHAPEPNADLESYRRFASASHQRLVLEELYLLELGLALRHCAQASQTAPVFDVAGQRVRSAPGGLPFRLTAGQLRAWEEIRDDLGMPHPMNRLLQGDVGSGKTAVALLAAAAAAASHYQCALMAPTELLVEQHARTLQRLVDGSGEALRLSMGLLTASSPRAEAERTRRRLAAGEIDVVVGTHALLQEGVSFARLALTIIDEQHRFGVRQRAALVAKAQGAEHPHTLVMTATPIPRTLALTLYGDLDVSVIDELPPGRAPVKTLLLREGEGRAVTELVRETVGRGEQVYVVYPLVEESERTDLRSAMASARRIAAAFPDQSVDLVHGRLDAEARAGAMARFEGGETQILVSTTVIEVGVDVPAATLMVIEHAERFGLAQLHQLRGRVGRDRWPGTCVMVARGGSEDSEARLRTMLETGDGFEIADADLRLRGPGEFLGTRQSGTLPDLRVAELVRDVRLVSVAREAAFDAVRRDPGLRDAPELRRAVESRWGDRLALAGVG
jgi:ATP-dependent DNA helicase RecG